MAATRNSSDRRETGEFRARQRRLGDRLLRLVAPRRRRGIEYLDEPGVDARVVRRSLRDVALANSLFGGARTALRALEPLLDEAAAAPSRSLSLVDVGTGIGDIPARARRLAAQRGVQLRTFGIDGSETLARAARSLAFPTVRADACRLPLADGAVDVAMCSQVLHHFEGDGAMALLRELDRVARRRVIVSDLRRSWIAAAGIWVASWILHFHPVSRHDGVVSVLRGFTRGDLRELIRVATGRKARVRHRLGFRICATWEPRRARVAERGA